MLSSLAEFLYGKQQDTYVYPSHYNPQAAASRKIFGQRLRMRPLYMARCYRKTSRV